MLEERDFDPSIGWLIEKKCTMCGRADELDEARIRSLAKSREMAALKGVMGKRRSAVRRRAS